MTPGEHVETQLAACTSTGEQHERQMSRAQSSDPNNANKQPNVLFTVQGDRRTTLQHELQPPGLSDDNTAVDSMFDESEERDAVVGHVGPFDDAAFDTTWQYGVVVTNWASLNTCDVALPGCSQVRVSPALLLVCGSRRDCFASLTTFFVISTMFSFALCSFSSWITTIVPTSDLVCSLIATHFQVLHLPASCDFDEGVGSLFDLAVIFRPSAGKLGVMWAGKATTAAKMRLPEFASLVGPPIVPVDSVAAAEVETVEATTASTDSTRSNQG